MINTKKIMNNRLKEGYKSFKRRNKINKSLNYDKNKIIYKVYVVIGYNKVIIRF